ncbi:hypothetical protein WME81_49670 [Sorangium sp. So ce1078]
MRVPCGVETSASSPSDRPSRDAPSGLVVARVCSSTPWNCMRSPPAAGSRK